MRSRPETRFGRIFLYIHFLDSDRGLIGFFRVTESSQDISDEDPAKKQKCSFEASFIEVNLFLSSIALTSRPNAPADRLPYKRLLAQSFPDAKPVVASSTVVGQQAALQALNRLVETFRRSNHPPTLVHLQSLFTAAELRSAVPALQNLPMLCQSLGVGARVQDLTWLSELALGAIAAFEQSFDDFADRLQCARYAEIPLGNLATDMAVQMNDVLFARMLVAGRHVLWAAPEESPDLGGHDVSAMLGRLAELLLAQRTARWR